MEAEKPREKETEMLICITFNLIRSFLVAVVPYRNAISRSTATWIIINDNFMIMAVTLHYSNWGWIYFVHTLELADRNFESLYWFVYLSIADVTLTFIIPFKYLRLWIASVNSSRLFFLLFGGVGKLFYGNWFYSMMKIGKVMNCRMGSGCFHEACMFEAFFGIFIKLIRL